MTIPVNDGQVCKYGGVNDFGCNIDDRGRGGVLSTPDDGLSGEVFRGCFNLNFVRSIFSGPDEDVTVVEPVVTSGSTAVDLDRVLIPVLIDPETAEECEVSTDDMSCRFTFLYLWLSGSPRFCRKSHSRPPNVILAPYFSRKLSPRITSSVASGMIKNCMFKVRFPRVTTCSTAYDMSFIDPSANVTIVL